jgi:predicted enzyme related to lactoylglutathione lyase
MLSKHPIIPYIPVSDVARARRFYEQTIGLKVKEENQGGILYESGGGTVFLYKSAGAGTNRASTAYWRVDNVEAEVAELRKKGVKFEDYDMPGMKTENGILAGGGAAWFKDPDGNILAIIKK